MKKYLFFILLFSSIISFGMLKKQKRPILNFEDLKKIISIQDKRNSLKEYKEIFYEAENTKNSFKEVLIKFFLKKADSLEKEIKVMQTFYKKERSKPSMLENDLENLLKKVALDKDQMFKKKKKA